MREAATLFVLSMVYFLILPTTAKTIPIAVPSVPLSTHVVQSNFLGISFELSFVDEYFGNDTSSLPPTMVQYLAGVRSRTGNNSLRIRIGGNSMDSSTYVPSQTFPMLQLTDPTANFDDQPVNFGPGLWDVLDKVASGIGGAAYLIGLSLLNPNNSNVPLIAGAAAQKLNNNLDGFLLGNEPDLYTSHHNRPNIANYTTSIYMNEFRTVSNHLTNTSAGNILNQHDIGGPTICCLWDLDALLNDGYTSSFGNILKYISLQHYPQNNCFGGHQYDISYYRQHSNVVSLASWQKPGITQVISNNGTNKQEVIMSEFNSASCGGIPFISDTFAVGSLWTVDYALQLASVGYSAAYLHTRERGISYNIVTPPNSTDNDGPWTTNPPYYSLLVTAEALRSKNGSIVVDLDINSSRENATVTVSGYAVYDAVDLTVQQLVFFNYANVNSSTGSSASFAVPASVFASGARNSLVVKYLVGEAMQETNNIGWGGETFSNVGDGKPVAANASWAPPNSNIDCTNGCTINVPAPGMAIVFAGSTQLSTQPTQGNKTDNGSPGTVTTNKNDSGRTLDKLSMISTVLSFAITAWTLLLISSYF